MAYFQAVKLLKQTAFDQAAFQCQVKGLSDELQGQIRQAKVVS